MKNIFVILLFSSFIYFVACSNDDSTQSSLSDLIGPTGGTVTSADNRVTLVIPPGALNEETEITITETSSHPAGNIGGVYDLQPDGLQFNSVAALNFNYSDDDLGSIDENTLTLAYAENDSWTTLTSVVEPSANTIAASIMHFTAFGIVSTADDENGCELLGVGDDVFTYSSGLITAFNAGGDILTFDYTDGMLCCVGSNFGYSYDLTYSAGSLTGIEIDDGVAIEVYGISYDENGRISELTEGINTETYTYDSGGNLVSSSSTNGDTGSWTYDDKINPISRLNLPAAVILLVLDANREGALSTNNPLTAVEIEPDLTRTGTYTYTYNEDGYPLTAVAVFIDSITETDEWTYTYDCN